MKSGRPQSGHPLWVIVALLGAVVFPASGQTGNRQDLAQRVQDLTAAVAKAQTQIEQSQRELQDLQRQLSTLKEELAKAGSSQPAPDAAAQLATQVDRLREQQQLQEAQIATHEQSKVESASKYRVSINGLVLLNGFVNTGKVDLAATPTIALAGEGDSGATLRQTMLGLNAHGPRLFGGRSYGDVAVDFFGGVPDSNYPGGSSGVGLLRLHTAHAGLDWGTTRASFLYDRPMISPNVPTSLTAIAIPSLAWSGNLWSWNTQVELRRDFALSGGHWFRTQAALIDATGSSQWSSSVTTGQESTSLPSTIERNPWPGVEARLAWLQGRPINEMQRERSAQFGIGGYFAPHRTYFGANFDSWAGTLDFRQPLPMHLQLSGFAYRGLALGGLGGGAYKDFAFTADSDNPGDFYYRALDDMGGWVQLKEHPNERLQFNAAIGIDNVPAGQLRDYAAPQSSSYQNLTRNRTFMGNVIYSPSAYLLFSFEYRRLESSTVTAPTASSDVVGIAAGYRF